MVSWLPNEQGDVEVDNMAFNLEEVGDRQWNTWRGIIRGMMCYCCYWLLFSMCNTILFTFNKYYF